MSSGVSETKEGVEKQIEAIGISSEHFANVMEINKYFEEHRINQLFSVRKLLI